MLPLENRLKKVRDFNLVTKYGRWLNGAVLDLKVLVLANNQTIFPPKEGAQAFQEQLKIAFSVGLKISKKAVVRNKLRRQLREIVRLVFKTDQPQLGFFVLIVPKKEALKKTYDELAKELVVLLRRAGVCRMVRS